MLLHEIQWRRVMSIDVIPCNSCYLPMYHNATIDPPSCNLWFLHAVEGATRRHRRHHLGGVPDFPWNDPIQVLQVPSFTPWFTIIPCGSDMIRCKKIQKDMWYGRYGWIFFCRVSRIEANIDTLNFNRKVLHVLSGWHICLKHVMHREWLVWILSSTRLAMQSPSSNWGVTSPMVDSTAQWKWIPISNRISMN